MKYTSLFFATCLFICLASFTNIQAIAQTHQVSSPDGKLMLEIKKSPEGYTYSFTANKVKLIAESALGFKTEAGDVVPSRSWSIVKTAQQKVNDVWKPVWGKRNIVPDKYNELVLDLENTTSSPRHFLITARAYNDGVAFRYEIPATGTGSTTIQSELTTYNFSDDFTTWFYNGENANIGPEKLSESDGMRLPVMTVKAGNNQYMAIHEANLITGQPLILKSEKGSTTFSVTSRPQELFPGYQSAWRVILCGNRPGVLVDSHTIELLNPDPAPGTDFSWVKPGVAVWDWRINGAVWDGFTYTMSYPSWIRMVDFAAEQGFLYLVLDADWYGPEFSESSDPVVGDKAKDVRKLIEYAKAKNIGIWLYLNDVGGRKYPLEETLKQYGEWGAAGVKYGFMSGSPEEKNLRTQKITALCAQNHLLVDFHDGPVHPYGQMRTWPNAVTREFNHAQLDAHRVFVPSTFVTTVFVNMVAGPLDMNNGMFDLRQGKTTRIDENQPVPSTLVSEAARTLIVFSGVTILPDIPEYYRKYPDLLNFLSAQKMPWIESKTLAGEIGEYIVMMRQTKDAILVAAATNEAGRAIELPLDFLGKEKYHATIIQDGPDAHYLTNRETLTTGEKIVTANEKIRLKLAPGGGACLLFKMLQK